MKKIASVVFAVIALGIMIAVFRFSSQDSVDTNALSVKFAEKTADLFIPAYSDIGGMFRPGFVFGLNLIIRKAAHFTLYFFMGFAVFAFGRGFVRSYLLTGVFSTVVCVLYAVSDEYHQSFTPGRTPLFKDVYIDTSGAILGAVVCFMVIASVKLAAKRIRDIKENNGNYSQ